MMSSSIEATSVHNRERSLIALWSTDTFEQRLIHLRNILEFDIRIFVTAAFYIRLSKHLNLHFFLIRMCYFTFSLIILKLVQNKASFNSTSPKSKAFYQENNGYNGAIGKLLAWLLPTSSGTVRSQISGALLNPSLDLY